MEATAEAHPHAMELCSTRRSNNAGISSIAPAETIEARTFRRALEVNLVAPFCWLGAFGKMMLREAAEAAS